jgi:hypothetical protein
MRSCCFVIACASLLLVASWPATATQYPSNESLAKELKAFAEKHSKIARVSSLAKSRGGHDVWLLQLGAGEKVDTRPALLVVAGIEGSDLAGTYSALSWAQSLAGSYGSNDARALKLLNTNAVYIIPRISADAADALFTKPQTERNVSSLPVDEDNDGLLDEDGPDDLNNDGRITWMRVEDPAGEYIIDAADPRLLLKADRTRGEAGRWRYLTEGRDNDGDEAWNEDGLGGVNFNRNFPHGYKFFVPNAGTHQISERETRALADFVVAHPNIAMVFTFGAADNLTQAPKGEAAGANRRPQSDVQPDDLPAIRELGKAWREAIGLKKELPPVSEPGTFSDWMYFHRGRLSLAARPWTPALQLELNKGKKTEKKDEAKKEEEKKDEKKPDNRNEEERAFLKWLDEVAKDSFLEWQRIDHPDFPGKTVEIGGFGPGVRVNPPAAVLEELAQKQGAFLTDLAGRFPELRVREVKVKNLGEGLFDITLQIENAGYLPTALTQGTVTREVAPTLLELKVGEKAVLSGAKRVALGAIEGSGGMKEARWIVRASNGKKVVASVTSAFAGSFEIEIELK